MRTRVWARLRRCADCLCKTGGFGDCGQSLECEDSGESGVVVVVVVVGLAAGIMKISRR